MMTPAPPKLDTLAPKSSRKKIDLFLPCRLAMALNIKDPETDRLVRRLTRLTGESITTAVKIAVRERVEPEERNRGKASVDELFAIAKRIASAPDRDTRSADEILGYDERGLPRRWLSIHLRSLRSFWWSPMAGCSWPD